MPKRLLNTNAVAALEKFPNAPPLCVTSAMHIFSDANTVDLDGVNDVRLSSLFFSASTSRMISLLAMGHYGTIPTS